MFDPDKAVVLVQYRTYIELEGPRSETNDALQWCYDNDFHVTRSGPKVVDYKALDIYQIKAYRVDIEADDLKGLQQ